MNAKRKVCVLGAGVIGLGTAVNIIEKIPDVEVTVIAEKFSPNTTSDGAAGIWLPPNAKVEHELGTDENRIRTWCVKTRQHLENIFRSPEAGNAGVQLLSGYHLFNSKEHSHEDNYDVDLFHGYRLLSESESKPFPQYKYGSHYTTYLAHCQMYLPWLMERFSRRGGTLQQGKVNSLEELVGKFDIVVTCVGLGAKWLLGDESMVPIRGQLIKVRAPWIKNIVRTFEDGTRTPGVYIFPGIDTISIGGTTQEDNWDAANNQEDVDRIWKNATEVLPSLKNVKPLYCWAGLRPFRKQGVRLEAETLSYGKNSLQVVHNYGHGSYGIIIHWGCALEATELVRRSLSRLVSRL